MSLSALTGLIDQLTAQRDHQRQQLSGELRAAKTSGREALLPEERRAIDDLAALDARIKDLQEENQRAGTTPSGSRPGRATRPNCRPGSEVMPLNFDIEELRQVHGKVMRQESAFLTQRAFNEVSSLLPAQLYPTPLFPLHEGRIADYLPAFALEAPSLEYIQMAATTGTATVVAEGTAKPELVMPTDKVLATAVKIAAHTGVSWEAIQDFDAFVSSVVSELTSQVVLAENLQILSWLAGTVGILTHAMTLTPAFDDLELAITELRTGSALATADLMILNPGDWSQIRREKDLQGRYYVADDPSEGEVSTAWGVPVVTTTVQTEGTGWLLDTTKFGRLAVREALNLRIGTANDDFVKNIVRYVAEERCVLCVERPSAVMHISGLVDSRSAKATAKK